MLPSFLIIGGTKCGTTSLHAWLDRHPAVFMAPKETRFFAVPSVLSQRLLAPVPGNYWRGLGWYEAQFAGAGAAEAVGDATNAYTRDPIYPGVPARIHATLPDARLVYLVRDPMQRMESHYRHRLVMGTEWRGAEAALRADPSYEAASSYGRQLELYREVFPAEQVLVVRSEALFADPGRWLPAIEDFIGVKTRHVPDLPAENVTAERRAVPRAARHVAHAPGLRRVLPRVPGVLSKMGARGLGPKANRPPFVLSEGFAAELRERLAMDRDLLAKLAGSEVASWSLGGRRDEA